MSKRRGLSLDEKRTKMLELFHEKKQCYQLKELEKMAQKEKGITSMSVKEVLQSLVDDGLVDSDRIGTSNYFWAFPSKAANINKKKLRDLEEKLQELKRKKDDLSSELSLVEKGREESEERSALLEALQKKQSQRKVLTTELEQYKSCDPQTLKELREGTTVAKEAANRWTENVFAVKSWCKNKFSLEEESINKQFGIPEDFDYL